MHETPIINITAEMLAAADKLISGVTVNRTKASPIDTLTGILGEFTFAQFFYGDWQKNYVGQNKGKMDFPDIEIKTSAFPFNRNLNLLVREDYAKKRQPPFYVQIIIDIERTNMRSIPANTNAIICGFATHRQVSAAPKKDFGSKLGKSGGYLCYYIPVSQLNPMDIFKQTYQRFRELKSQDSVK